MGKGSHPGDPEKWERAEAEFTAWNSGGPQITEETFAFLDAMLRTMLRRSRDPDEVSTEAWAHLTKYAIPSWRPDLQSDPNFPRWFFYSARRAIGAAVVRLYGRKDSRRRKATLTSVSLYPDEKARAMAIEPFVFDDEYVDRDGGDAAPPKDFRALTKALSPDDRAILEFRYVDGASLQEIADVLGIGHAGAHTRITAALSRYRRIHGIELGGVRSRREAERARAAIEQERA